VAIVAPRGMPARPVPRGDVGVARYRYTFPEPPVARTVASATKVVGSRRAYSCPARRRRAPRRPPVVEGGELPPRDEVDRRVVLEDPDPGILPGADKERPFHLAAGQVFRVENPPSRVSPLAVEVEFPSSGLPGELHTPLDQFADPRGASRTTRSTVSAVAKPRPALWVSSMWDSKVSSSLQTVAIPPCASVGARLGRLLLGDDVTGPFFAAGSAQTQTGDFAADGPGISIPFPCTFPHLWPTLFDFGEVCT